MNYHLRERRRFSPSVWSVCSPLGPSLATFCRACHGCGSLGCRRACLLGTAPYRRIVHTWKLNVIVGASGRAHDLALVESRNFWLGTVREFYLGNPFAGTFALGLLCYVAASIIWIYYERSRSHDRKLRFLVLAITGIWMFFALSVLLGVTNVDLESTAASLLPIGLLGLCLAFGLKNPSRRIICAIALAFSLWLGWRGLYSIHRHSRLLIPTQVLWYHNTYPVNEGYLKGALLCKLNAQQLSDAQRIVSHFQTIAGSSEIYWGPGTECFLGSFRPRPSRASHCGTAQ